MQSLDSGLFLGHL